MTKKGNKKTAAGGKNISIPGVRRVAKAPLPTAVLKDEADEAGLPAFQILFSLPKNSQWHAGKRTLRLVYGGGSTPGFHGIPYQALASTSLSRLSQKTMWASSLRVGAGKGAFPERVHCLEKGISFRRAVTHAVCSIAELIWRIRLLTCRKERRQEKQNVGDFVRRFHQRFPGACRHKAAKDISSVVSLKNHCFLGG